MTTSSSPQFKNNWLLSFCRIVFLGGLLVTPWALGSVLESTQQILAAGLTGILLLFTLGSLFNKGGTSPLPFLLIPLFLGIGLGFGQLLHLPSENLSAVTIKTPEVRETFTVKSQTDQSADTVPMSLSPASTRQQLALLILSVGSCLLGAFGFSRWKSQRWLLGAVALNGAAFALFGIAQKFSWNGKIYWRIPIPKSGGAFAAFVNRNNAGGYLLLCLSAALGLVTWLILHKRQAEHHTSRNDWQLAQRHWLAALTSRFFNTNPLLLWVMLGITILVAAILMTLSRGSWVALVGAGCLTGSLVLWCQRDARRLWVMAASVVLPLGLLGWLGMTPALWERFDTFFDTKLMSQTRLPNWKNGWQAAQTYQPWGTGLGTYRHVYGEFQNRHDEDWYYHAENQYLETAVEAGWPGLVLLLCCLLISGWSAWRLLRFAPDASTFALGVAGIFAVSSQTLHAVFDFGLLLPANSLLFALLCGMVCGKAVRLEEECGFRIPLGLPAGRLLQTATVTALLLLLVFSTTELSSAAAVSTARRNAVYEITPDAVSLAVLKEKTVQLEQALRARPDDAEGQHRLARLYLHRYQLEKFEQLKSGSGLDVQPETTWDFERLSDARRKQWEGLLWKATSPGTLYWRSQMLQRNNLDFELSRFRADPLIQTHLRSALTHLELANHSCPLIADVHLLLGSLQGVVEDFSGSGNPLDLARRLAPADPRVQFKTGLLDLYAGRTEQTVKAWRTSLSLTHRYWQEIRLHALQLMQLTEEQLLSTIVPDDAALLLHLAETHYQQAEKQPLQKQLAERIVKLTGKRNPTAEEQFQRGVAWFMLEKPDSAIEELSEAVRREPHQSRWRYELSRACLSGGQLREARRHIRICLWKEPSNPLFQELLNQTTSAALDDNRRTSLGIEL